MSAKRRDLILTMNVNNSYLEAPVYSVFHNCNELSVAQLSISIFIKDLEHSTHQVVAQVGSSANLHCTNEFVWKHLD